MAFESDGMFSGYLSEFERIEYEDDRALLTFTLPIELGYALRFETELEQVPVQCLVRAAGQYAYIGSQIEGYRLTDRKDKVVGSFPAHSTDIYPDVLIGGTLGYLRRIAVPTKMAQKLEQLQDSSESSLSGLLAAGLEDRTEVKRYHAAGLIVSAIKHGTPTRIVPIN